MNLGIFLSSGESFITMSRAGQDERFKKFYLRFFSKKFSKVYIFTYANEKVVGLPRNVKIVPNKYQLPRFAYGILLPAINQDTIRQCDIIRAYHILGTVPAIITRIVYCKKFVFNWGYDYIEFAKMEKKWLQAILIKLISPIAFKFSSKIIATTKAALKFTPTEKSIYIPNGVDIQIFKPTHRKKNNKRLRILNIGRLEPQKNQINLVKAVRGLNVELTIVGNGSLKEKLQSLAIKTKAQVTFIDKIENTGLPKIYRNSDIFVLPSLTEGPVKVLIEAMACGLPVIGANVSGINEIIKDGENGLFCTTSKSSIRSTIKILANDYNLRLKLSKNARLTIAKNFDLKKLLKKETETIKSLYND